MEIFQYQAGSRSKDGVPVGKRSKLGGSTIYQRHLEGHQLIEHGEFNGMSPQISRESNTQGKRAGETAFGTFRLRAQATLGGCAGKHQMR